MSEEPMPILVSLSRPEPRQDLLQIMRSLEGVERIMVMNPLQLYAEATDEARGQIGTYSGVTHVQQTKRADPFGDDAFEAYADHLLAEMTDTSDPEYIAFCDMLGIPPEDR